MSKRFLGITVIVIVLAGLATYANSFSNEFVWDDYDLIKNNIYIKSWSRLPKIFSTDIAAGGGEKYNFYRPLQMLTYMVDYSLWRLEVRGYHLTNTVLHILAALAVFWLIFLVTGKSFIALATALLFVVHPVHTEAVAYISGRADSLSLIFILVSFICYMKGLKRQRAWLNIVMLISYVCALLSRENALILPFLILLYHGVFEKRVLSRSMGMLAMVACVYALMRLTLLGELMPHTVSSSTVLQRVPGMFVALASYLRLLLLPMNLHMEYGNKLFAFSDPRVWAGVGLTAAAVWYLSRRQKTNRTISFSVAWFFVAFLPIANLYPLIIAYMAEHWLYIPSIGFCLGVSYGIWRFSVKKDMQVLATAVLAALVIFYSALSIKQNTRWKNPLTLYTWTLAHAPESVRTLTSLGVTYKAMGKEEEAIQCYEKAQNLDPEYVSAIISLAVLYNGSGHKQKAIELYQKVLSMRPNHAKAYFNLGLVYDELGKRDDAVKMYNRSLENAAFNIRAHNNLANIYREMGKTDKAIASYKKAIELDPGFVEAYGNLGLTYIDKGEYKKALSVLDKAVKIDPTDPRIYSFLGDAYSDCGEKEKSVTMYKAALQHDPQYSDAYVNLGVVYRQLGKIDEAIDAYKKAVRLQAEHPVAYYNLAILYFRLQKYNQAIVYYDQAKDRGYENQAMAEALQPYR